MGFYTHTHTHAEKDGCLRFSVSVSICLPENDNMSGSHRIYCAAHARSLRLGHTLGCIHTALGGQSSSGGEREMNSESHTQHNNNSSLFF